MAKQHYALIEKEGCNPLEITYPQPRGLADGNSLRREEQSDTGVRVELEKIYQKYAEIYPNPNLLEEKRQRDTLLKAAKAASSFEQETRKAKTKSRGGFFTFLFGTRDKEEKDADNKASFESDTDVDENLLKYTDTHNEYADESLCGTQQSLDVSCIPPEVYHVARSHLSSTRTRRDNPNALRWGPRSRMLSQQKPESETCTMFIVVGLGEIAEFGGSPCHVSSSSRILRTSDRDKLLEYAERTHEFELSGVRGTILSQNCVAISWGFMDGLTVFYRRRLSIPRNNDESAVEGWEAVWWVGPSRAILENLNNNGQDLFHDDSEQPESPLLKISDCLALHVEAPVTSRNDQQTKQEIPTVATLVISRLGGYIELVPLPDALWKGPIIERDMVPSRRARSRQRQRQYHYATGQKIVCPKSTLALTTFDYHLDVQALEVFRTSVNSETIWNSDEYPDGPPAEFLLVASGVSVDGGCGETMTFWAVSTLFQSNEEELAASASNSKGKIDFQVHSRLLEAMWTSTGAPVSTFATPEIMSRWRTPRQVELRDTACTTGDTKEESELGNQFTKQLTPVTTLSTTAPIVSMKFSGSNISTSETTSNGPLLSVLDWNGGVQIFDCSVIERLASQSLTPIEYKQYRGEYNDSEQKPTEMNFNLVGCLVLRNQVGTALQKLVSIPAVTNLQWLESINQDIPSLAFFLNYSKILTVVSFDSSDQNKPEGHSQEPLKLSMTSVPFPVAGTAMESHRKNSISFVSLRKGRMKSSVDTTTHLLKYVILEQLQPVAIVETLARESKYEEAINSAKKLSKQEQNKLASVVNDCHRKVWENKRNVDSLIATNDETYILVEVLSIFESDENECQFSLDDLRSLLKLALQIISNNDEKGERLRKVFVRLGTFELLCKFYESKASFEQFQRDFLEVDIHDLSVELARRGDISALSIVLFRHRFEVHENLLSILGSIPLSIQSSSYWHLLPVLQNGHIVDRFLDFTAENIVELPWSHMPQYTLEKYTISIVFDRFDELVVLEYNNRLNGGVDKTEDSVKSLLSWFVERAKRMQTFVGDVDDVINFTKVGMKCFSLRNDENNYDTGVIYDKDLHVIWRTALSLKRMLLDQSIDDDGINTDDLASMNLVELLNLVLGCDAEGSVIRYRFHEYIQPLVMELSSLSSNDDLDEALVAYCLKEVQECTALKAAMAKRVLSSSVAIASISNASLHKKDRLIKSKEKLILMVLEMVDEISKELDVVEVSMNDRREIVESFWSLYETLPAQLASPQSENEEKLKTLYDDLVGIDIVSRWPGCNPFKFHNKRKRVFQEENGTVLEICKSFTSVIMTIASPQNQVALLQDLLCDVKNLNEVVFKNSIDLPTILCNCLIPKFLEEGCFGLVASYLGSNKDVMDENQVIHIVTEYVDEAMFSEGDNRDRIINAIKCQDALGPLLPQIQPLFQSNRRFLDASHFISSVLLDGNSLAPLSPSDLKLMTALDAVEMILREFPQCIGCRCSQWMDPDYAKDANKGLRQAGTPTSVETTTQENTELPELPGGAIFHLATILGLESNIAALVVKSRVIYHALQGEYYGAGAAIARTLLHDQEFGSGVNPATDTIILRTIADLVSIEKYSDKWTKKELCETVLRRFDRKVCIEDYQSFNVILQISSNLDHLISRFDQEVGILSPDRKQRLLSRPIARLYDHTLFEYKRDMHCLFKDLGDQFSEGLVHDSLMDVLSRFVFYWCIHDSISTRSVIDLRQKADSYENLKLGCGLVLQIPSIHTAESSVHELQETSLNQAGRVASEERFGISNDYIIPNPDILKHLIDRGFTENAARKAAVMTSNAGNNEAMAWAVGHAMDPNLNNPLILLKSSRSQFIDESAIQMLQKSLIQLSDIVSNPSFRSAFLRNLTNGFQNIDIPVSSSSKTTTNSTAMRLNKARKMPSKPRSQLPQKSTVENKLKQPGNDVAEKFGTKMADSSTPVTKGRRVSSNLITPNTNNRVIRKIIDDSKTQPMAKNDGNKQTKHKERRPPPTPPRALPHKMSNSTEIGSEDSTSNTKSDAKVGNSPGGNDSRIKARTGITDTAKLLVNREELTQRGQKALDKLKNVGMRTSSERTTPRATTTGVGREIRTRAKTGILARGRKDPATRPEIDREELRKRGQAALDRLRSTNNRPESRSRLIEEGRRLLKQSKSKTPQPPLSDRTVDTTRSLASASSKKAPSQQSENTRAETSKPIVSNVNSISRSNTPGAGTNKIGNGTGKALKIESDDIDEDAGWDFEDFDNF